MSRRTRRSSASNFREHILQRSEPRGVHHSKHSHLQMKQRIRLATEIVIRLQKYLEVARQFLFTEQSRRPRDHRPLFRSRGNQIGIRAANARHHQIPEVAYRFTAEVLEVAALRL